MKWMKERDLLIAQTMAFAQSVAGKRPDAGKVKTAPQAEKPAVAATPTPEMLTPAIEAALAETALALEPPTAAQPPRFVKLDIQGDFQSEVRARVASFRAHQERFLREREEYCSSTMAKVRDSLRETAEPSRFGK